MPCCIGTGRFPLTYRVDKGAVDIGEPVNSSPPLYTR